MKLLEQYTPDVSVYVVRRYGGVHLGPKRFKIMQDIVIQAFTRAAADKKT